MTMSHYSSCHPSSLLRLHSLQSPRLLFLLSAFLPPAAAFVTRPFSTHLPFFLFFSVLALCLKTAHLTQHLQHPFLYPCLLLCSPSPSIYLSITPTSLSLPLISLPMLWFVSCLCQDCYHCCQLPWREQSRPLLTAPQKTREK